MMTMWHLLDWRENAQEDEARSNTQTMQKPGQPHDGLTRFSLKSRGPLAGFAGVRLIPNIV